MNGEASTPGAAAAERPRSSRTSASCAPRSRSRSKHGHFFTWYRAGYIELGQVHAASSGASLKLTPRTGKVYAAPKGARTTLRRLFAALSHMSDIQPLPALPHAQYERFESMREHDAMFDELIPPAQQTIRIFDSRFPRSSTRLPAASGSGDFLSADAPNRALHRRARRAGRGARVPAFYDAAPAIQPRRQSAADATLGAPCLRPLSSCSTRFTTSTASTMSACASRAD